MVDPTKNLTFSLLRFLWRHVLHLNVSAGLAIEVSLAALRYHSICCKISLTCHELLNLGCLSANSILQIMHNTVLDLCLPIEISELQIALTQFSGFCVIGVYFLPQSPFEHFWWAKMPEARWNTA